MFFLFVKDGFFVSDDIYYGKSGFLNIFSRHKRYFNTQVNDKITKIETDFISINIKQEDFINFYLIKLNNNNYKIRKIQRYDEYGKKPGIPDNYMLEVAFIAQYCFGFLIYHYPFRTGDIEFFLYSPEEYEKRFFTIRLLARNFNRFILAHRLKNMIKQVPYFIFVLLRFI